MNQGVKQGGNLSTHLYKTYIDPLLNVLKSKRLGFYLGTVYLGDPTVADDVVHLSKFKDELQLMLNESQGYSSQNRYQIHPVKTQVVSLPYMINEDLKWTLGENVIKLADKTVHLGLIRSGRKESELNIKDRISLARRTSYSLINTGLHGTNGLNPKTSYVIYSAYVLPRLLYGLEVISLNKTQIKELERYHLNTLRQIQSLPKRTASSSVYMLLGALPIEAELHKRQLSLLYAVLTSENQCLQEVVQRQLARCFDNVHSFFYIASQVLEKYQLPTMSKLLTTSISKLKWKHIYKKAIETFWTKVYVSDIKSKKTLKYLYTSTLKIGTTHLVWNSIDSEAEVRKGAIKARVLTGVYILQSNIHLFSGGTVDATCQLCCLEEKDIYHLVTRCPAFYDIRVATVERLRQIVLEQIGGNVWSTYFKDWEMILRVLICPDCVRPMVPGLSVSLNHIEKVSRTFFYKVHLKRLNLLKQRE